MTHSQKESRPDVPSFVRWAFSPHVAVLCSDDSTALCKMSSLTFVQVLEPFRHLSQEVQIRDTNAAAKTITDAQIVFNDISSTTQSKTAPRQQLNDIVSKYDKESQASSQHRLLIDDYDLSVQSDTPWYFLFRRRFLELLPISDFDFLKHNIACIFVVSTNHPDPLAEFQRLTDHQHSMQHSSAAVKSVRWFNPNILRYYVLLHDCVRGDDQKAEAVYKQMKTQVYSPTSCHLLQINSRDPQGPFSPQPYLTQPWAHLCESSADENSAEDTYNTTTTDSSQPIVNNSVDDIDHPLSLEKTPDSVDPTSVEHTVLSSRTCGAWLTLTDHDRIKIFISEFYVRALVPWVERTIRSLTEQLRSRKGLQSAFLGATRKWFAGNKAATPPRGSSPQPTVVYTMEAPEMRLRRLADLAFMFNLYELAYDSYHACKKEFNSDHAWLHLAGVQEMAAISVFMQGYGSSRSYPHHYMDAAITGYINGKLPMLAARAVIFSSAMLSSKLQLEPAAMHLVRLTGEDSDLRSALFLEQAALCYLRVQPSPMIAKYAFHLILSAHRYNKASQKDHALRCYGQSLQVYQQRRWDLATDNIFYTVGKIQYSLGDLLSALESFDHLLRRTGIMQTPSSQQTLFLKEYLQTYNALSEKQQMKTLPELPLPVIHAKAVTVRLGSTTSTAIDEDTESMLAAPSYPNNRVPVSFKPCQTFFSNETTNENQPVAYIGESILVSIAVENPIQVPIGLFSIVPIIEFVYSDSDGTQASISSDSNQFQDFVSVVPINDLLIGAGDKQWLVLNVVPLKEGQLLVHGLAYGLSNAACTKDKEQVCSVFGEQRFVIRGPKLFSTRDHLKNKQYAVDRRLHISVQTAMPDIEMKCSLSDSYTVFCGQIYRLSLTLSPRNHIPAKNIRLLVTGADCFIDLLDTSVDGPLDTEQIVEVNQSRQKYFDISYETLRSKSRTIPLWLRAPQLDASKEVLVSMVLYYEHGTSKTTRHKVCCLQQRITVMNPFSLCANCLPTNDNSGVLIPFLIRNTQPNSSNSGHIVSFVAAASVGPKWSVSYLGSLAKAYSFQQSAPPPSIERPNSQFIESPQMRSDSALGSATTNPKDSVQNSTSTCKSDAVQSNEFPPIGPNSAYMDLVLYTQNKLNATGGSVTEDANPKRIIIKLIGAATLTPVVSHFLQKAFENAVSSGNKHEMMYLGILWKISTDDKSTGFGMHFLSLSKDVKEITVPNKTEVADPSDIKPVLLRRRLSAELTPEQLTVLRTKQIVRDLSCRFVAPSILKHDFSQKRLCLFTVKFRFSNHSSKEPYTIKVDASLSEGPEKHLASLENTESISLTDSKLQWIGINNAQVTVEPFSTREIKLSCAVQTPGTYDLSSSFSASVSDGSTDVFLSLNPSVLTIEPLSRI